MLKQIVAVSAILVTAAFVASPVNAFHANDLPVISTEATDGNAAYGLRVDTDGSDFAIDLLGYQPITSSKVSAAVFLLDANGNTLFGFALTGHMSPDRLIIEPLSSGDATAVPDWLEIREIESDTDARLAVGIGLTGRAPPAGSYYYAVWIGGADTGEFTVRGQPGVSVTANAGKSYVLGDPELNQGVQVQQTIPLPYPLGQRVGAKLMKDVSITIPVENKIFGFWGSADFKLACSFAVGACLWKSTVEYQCRAITGQNCGTTKISYDGPNGGGSGYGTYAMLGGPSGDYTFTVDQKLDLYGPGYYNPQTGTFVFLGEDGSYLTVADVKVPA